MTDSTPPERRAPKTRGRRQDPERTAAILKAAARHLLDVGYDRFRIQEVAKRAACGTGAIYRRWSSKEALVAEAIRAMPPSEVFDSDDPWADLRAIVHRECERYAKRPDRVPGLVSAMQSDPGIQQAVREGYSVEAYRTLLARVLGPDNPHLGLLAELTPGVLLLRASFEPQALDTEATTDAVLALIRAVAGPPG
mgnify:CR=1 FL=1